MATKQPSLDHVKAKIEEFLNSELQREKKIGLDYYHGVHDIRKKLNKVYDPALGKFILVEPNNIVTENLYCKFVDQKVNYAFGKPFKITLSEENEEYHKILDRYLTDEFYFLVKKLAKDAINCGFGWIIPYIDNSGEFRLKRLSPIGVFPVWLDEEHTELEELYRAFIEPAEIQQEAIPITVEVYKKDEMYRFEYLQGQLQIHSRLDFVNHYMDFGEIAGDWNELPAIPFKANDNEIPLIRTAKGAQDALNTALSAFADDIEKSPHSSIKVLKGFDPTFKNAKDNLSLMNLTNMLFTPADGSADLLQPKIDTAAYELSFRMLRKALASACNAIDLESLQNLGNHINEAGIKSSYMALDADTDAIYSNFNWALKRVVKFLNKYLIYKREFKPEFEKIKVDFVFVKNQLINETELINNLRNLVGIVSQETILKNIPYVDDVAEELDKLETERKSELQDNFFAVNDEEKKSGKDDDS